MVTSVIICAKSLSHVWLLAVLWTVAHQGALSMGFSRQDYWTCLPCPPSVDLPYPGIELKASKVNCIAVRFFATGTTWEALLYQYIPYQNFAKNLVLLFLIFSINIRIINKYKRFSLSLQSSTRPIILLSSNKNLHSYKYLEQKPCRSCLFSNASNLTAEFVRQSQKFLLTVLISLTFIYFSLVAFLFISESMRMPVKVDR